MTFMRAVAVAFTVGLFVACTSTSNELSSEVRACAPDTFYCDARTPGYWSNKNGCEAFGPLMDGLNENRALAELAPVESCDALDEILHVDAEAMEDKLIAMWTAFTLNQLEFFDGDCYADNDVYFRWTSSLYPENGASKQCKEAVEGWFEDESVTFAELNALAIELITSPSATECEQEALKDFFDDVNNRDSLCLCDCPTGATGATGSGGGGTSGL